MAMKQHGLLVVANLRVWLFPMLFGFFVDVFVALKEALIEFPEYITSIPLAEWIAVAIFIAGLSWVLKSYLESEDDDNDQSSP